MSSVDEVVADYGGLQGDQEAFYKDGCSSSEGLLTWSFA
jgi:hypothetical protein